MPTVVPLLAYLAKNVVIVPGPAANIENVVCLLDVRQEEGGI